MTNVEKGIGSMLATLAMLVVVSAICLSHNLGKLQEKLSLPTQGQAYTPDLFPVPSNTVYVVTVRQQGSKYIVAFTNQAGTQMTADSAEFKQKYYILERGN